MTGCGVETVEVPLVDRTGGDARIGVRLEDDGNAPSSRVYELGAGASDESAGRWSGTGRWSLRAGVPFVFRPGEVDVRFGVLVDVLDEPAVGPAILEGGLRPVPGEPGDGGRDVE